MKFNYLNPSIGDDLKKCKNIAIIKLAYIGDSVWLIPFINNLKRNLPDTKITVIVNRGTEAFFLTSSNVDNVITFDRKNNNIWYYLKFIKSIRDIKAEAIFELTDTDRPALLSFLSGAKYIIGYNNENRWRNRLYTHICSGIKFQKHFVQYHLDVLTELGLEIFDTTLNIQLNPECYKTIRVKVPELSNVKDIKTVVIHPGSRNILRQWGSDRFAALCDLLNETPNPCRIILTAGPNERHLLSEIVSAMKTPPPIISDSLTLYEFAALCEASDLFIGNDSGPIHIAAARNTFVVGIYGPTLPQHVGAWTKRKIVIQKDLECRPCYVESCKISEHKKCLYSITPVEVFQEIKNML